MLCSLQVGNRNISVSSTNLLKHDSLGEYTSWRREASILYISVSSRLKKSVACWLKFTRLARSGGEDRDNLEPFRMCGNEVRCGISAGCLVDLQTSAAGIQTPAGHKRKARQNGGRDGAGDHLCVLSVTVTLAQACALILF